MPSMESNSGASILPIGVGDEVADAVGVTVGVSVGKTMVIPWGPAPMGI